MGAQQVPESQAWLDAVRWGLVPGLSTSGLYSGAKRAVEGKGGERRKTGPTPLTFPLTPHEAEDSPPGSSLG